MSLGQEVGADYSATFLSLKAHPLFLLRDDLAARGITRAVDLKPLANGSRITVAGLVIARQRPGSAKGVVFATLEDETGIANIVLWPKVFERFRRAAMTATLLIVRGTLQKDDKAEHPVIHIIADRLMDRSPDLRRLATAEDSASEKIDIIAGRQHDRRRFPSRDFH
jgi:error-prone DNA polymerase